MSSVQAGAASKHSSGSVARGERPRSSIAEQVVRRVLDSSYGARTIERLAAVQGVESPYQKIDQAFRVAWYHPIEIFDGAIQELVGEENDLGEVGNALDGRWQMLQSIRGSVSRHVRQVAAPFGNAQAEAFLQAGIFECDAADGQIEILLKFLAVRHLWKIEPSDDREESAKRRAQSRAIAQEFTEASSEEECLELLEDLFESVVQATSSEQSLSDASKEGLALRLRSLLYDRMLSQRSRIERVGMGCSPDDPCIGSFDEIRPSRLVWALCHLNTRPNSQPDADMCDGVATVLCPPALLAATQQARLRPTESPQMMASLLISLGILEGDQEILLRDVLLRGEVAAVTAALLHLGQPLHAEARREGQSLSALVLQQMHTSLGQMLKRT